MESLLEGLKAAAEPTRLRLLALCAETELSVSELTAILGQSQPRVSRHLKLLCDGGLLERFREGAFVFYRLARDGDGLARALARLIPPDDAVVALDRSRLAEIERRRAGRVAQYFEENAHRWNTLRSLHVPEGEVEARLLDLVGRERVGEMLDIGTGTGRMLEVFGPLVEHGVGIDASLEMLAVARVNLERAGRRNCTVRQADMYALPFSQAGFDLVTLHQVLHFAERPGDAIAEAARVTRPGGRLIIVDFAPHELEGLREAHAHRRLGFSDDEIRGWAARAGLVPGPMETLPGERLTVAIWPALAPHISSARRQTAPAPSEPLEEIAS